MALTKIHFYLGVISLIIIVFLSIDYVGTGLVNEDRISLDGKSLDYIAEIKGINTQHGYDTIANTSSAESQEGNILDSSDDSQVSDTNDFLSTLYIKKERASAPTNFFKLVYNIPSSMIRGLGLNIGDWNNYINIFSYIIFISIIILVWTRLINT